MDQQYQCALCSKTFSRATHLRRHMNNTHSPNIKLQCPHCNSAFNRQDNLQHHVKEKHNHNSPCLKIQRTEEPQRGTTSNFNTSTQDKQIASKLTTAMRGYLASYQINASDNIRDPLEFLQTTADVIDTEIRSTLRDITGVKLWPCLKIEFFKPTLPKETTRGHFCSKAIPILRGNNISQSINSLWPGIIQSIDKFSKEGSGWAVSRILQLDFHLARYQPRRASSYIKLPKSIESKKATINIQNTDNKCFMWSVLAALHPITSMAQAQRYQHYVPFQNELTFEGIDFPVAIKDIAKFEQLNNLSINIYGWEDILYPIYISNGDQTHIDLLIYEGQYVLIRSLDRLLSDQRRFNGKKYFCHRCLFPFYSEERLKDHHSYCIKGSPTRIEVPKETDLKFKNIHRCLRQPVVVYCDFECLTEPISLCSQNLSLSSTTAYQHHKPCSYGLIKAKSCCSSPLFDDEPTVYRGENPPRALLLELIAICQDHQQTINNQIPLIMNSADWTKYATNNCSICKQQIMENEIKVRDHCHLCGKFRGAAHDSCNQALRLGRDVIVVFHNLRRYDGHIIMQEAGDICNEKGFELQCIAKAMEDYLSFSIRNRRIGDGRNAEAGWRIKFIDSVQFLNASLDSLVKSLPRNKFHAMEKHLEAPTLPLMLRKGVYCYDYMDNVSRFDETELPKKEAFHSELSGESITDEDYNHALTVWNAFGIHTLGEYHDLYLKTDVLLLADVVEEFREVCLNTYGLDPLHYITLPSFAWDACLKITGVKLELLKDPDLYAFFEEGKRGGISVISHRYGEANNQAFTTYNSTQPISHIIYVDANNLYGWAMVRHLPTSGFRFLDPSEIDEIDWLSLANDAAIGYFLEVDLDYPQELHDLHNDYPLAPESLHITTDMLSPYCKDLSEELNLRGGSVRKLTPNLMPKIKYKLHYQNLKLYLRLGLKLTKIHRVVIFQQSPWMKDYIDLNTTLRTAAKADFEKDLFKLMNNAVFGKTMENVRNYHDVQLVTVEQKFLKLVANPRYKRSSIFNEDLVGVSMAPKIVSLNKPIYAGCSILDMSKILMYEYHYDYIAPTYGSKAKLLFTDTDSFIYMIKTNDVYKDMFNNSCRFDTSDYPKDHFLYSLTNKKVLGKMKDEKKGIPIYSFVGLRSKMYSFVCNGEDKKRAKGIKKSVVNTQITFENYYTSLFSRRRYQHTMNLIRADKHQLYSIHLKKSSLSPYDDKRYIVADGITTLAYGHYSIVA